LSGITDPGYKALNNRAQLAHLIEPNEGIDLRQLLAQFFGKPLRHTTAHDQSLVRAFSQAALLVHF
jgi:hypothetical protein